MHIIELPWRHSPIRNTLFLVPIRGVAKGGRCGHAAPPAFSLSANWWYLTINRLLECSIYCSYCFKLWWYIMVFSFFVDKLVDLQPPPPTIFFSFAPVCMTFFLLQAIATFLKSAMMFLLLKISDPLTCMVTLNLCLLPNALIHAFIYKREFLLSTLKVIFLLVFNAVVTCCKERDPNIASKSSNEMAPTDSSKTCC